MATITVNNQPIEVDDNDQTPLLWLVREKLQLTGTKFGCGQGLCGACTLLVNDSAVRACITPVSSVLGQSITTIEGLSEQGEHPLQKAWLEHRVPQCGYCQSGQIMSAAALLKVDAHPNRETIKSHMTGNICRCGTYSRITDAIESVVQSDLTER
ncbi:(2Fe-2S)-binding protein [Lacimicrobium sp. SS2-24]|uniref:(2Fe-2S)-binding protein n=1 Tax=Lacimicrobium sp. SS2-24 TaxID=2005569 RepID=UPI000B4AF764|nr:(2Fe-2S)-binding protein [Lacimicrobium sp. SS2-24]